LPHPELKTTQRKKTGRAHQKPVRPEEANTVEQMKIHAMLDQLEKECNGAMAAAATIDVEDLFLVLETVLESMTTLDPEQIAEILHLLCQQLEFERGEE